MSYSSLISGVVASPNYNFRKNMQFNPSGKILKITPHHAAAVGTAYQIAHTFVSEERQASANYVIGNDGEIIGVVDEGNRAWTSGSTQDYVAVTIEVSNSQYGEPWPISDKAWDSLVKLCVDICKRNGIEKLDFTGNEYGNLTAHRFFQATACPGTYLYNRFPELAETVNEKLNESEEDEPMTAAEKKWVQDELTKRDNKISVLESIVNEHTRVKYGYVDKNMPEWARPEITDLMQKGLLKGDKGGNLQLSYDTLRTFVIEDRGIQYIEKKIEKLIEKLNEELKDGKL